MSGRFPITLSLGNVLVIVTMLGSCAFVYGSIVSRITALEVKVDALSAWLHLADNRQTGSSQR